MQLTENQDPSAPSPRKYKRTQWNLYACTSSKTEGFALFLFFFLKTKKTKIKPCGFAYVYLILAKNIPWGIGGLFFKTIFYVCFFPHTRVWGFPLSLKKIIFLLCAWCGSTKNYLHGSNRKKIFFSYPLVVCKKC